MIAIPELTAQALGSFLSLQERGTFPLFRNRSAEVAALCHPFALECIGNSDALLRNIERYPCS